MEPTGEEQAEGQEEKSVKHGKAFSGFYRPLREDFKTCQLNMAKQV